MNGKGCCYVCDCALDQYTGVGFLAYMKLDCLYLLGDICGDCKENLRKDSIQGMDSE